MQVLFQLRNSTTNRRQGNTEVAAGSRKTPGIDRSQQDGHRLQSIHGIPSTNERVLPETTSYLAVLGGSISLAEAVTAVGRVWSPACSPHAGSDGGRPLTLSRPPTPSLSR